MGFAIGEVISKAGGAQIGRKIAPLLQVHASYVNVRESSLGLRPVDSARLRGHPRLPGRREVSVSQRLWRRAGRGRLHFAAFVPPRELLLRSRGGARVWFDLL